MFYASSDLSDNVVLELPAEELTSSVLYDVPNPESRIDRDFTEKEAQAAFDAHLARMPRRVVQAA